MDVAMIPTDRLAAKCGVSLVQEQWFLQPAVNCPYSVRDGVTVGSGLQGTRTTGSGGLEVGLAAADPEKGLVSAGQKLRVLALRHL